MMPISYRSYASLRIFSHTFTSREITEILRTEPTRFHEQGDIVSRRSPGGPFRKEAYWSLQTDLEKSQHLDEHIEQLVSFIEAQATAIEKLRPACQIEIFCFFSSGPQGFIFLPPELLERLGRLQIALGVDIYPGSED